MPTDNTTPNQNYQLPNGLNDLSHDVLRLIAMIGSVDADMANALATLASKAADVHNHTFDDITGLQNALDGKAADGHQHALNDMSNVDDSASTQYQFLMKSVTGWQPNKIDGSHIQTGTVPEARLPSYLAASIIAANTAKISYTDAAKVAGIAPNADVTGPANVASSGAAMLGTENQSLAGGVSVTSKSLGTKTSGTLTLGMGARPLQNYINGGAHTLAPGTIKGSCLLDITNNASAGAIATPGWTKVDGDSFTTTNGDKFRCSCSVGVNGSLLIVEAMQ